jgi:hypothetical protein
LGQQRRRRFAKPSLRSRAGRVPGSCCGSVNAAFAVQLAVMLRPLGNYSWASLLFPVPLAAWFVTFFRSIVATARGEVRRKGRTVPVRE